MKRKDFLATLPLLASLPFIKKKEKLTSADIAKKFNVPASKLSESFQSATYSAETLQERIEALDKAWREFQSKLHHSHFTIRGEDLVAVIKNKRNSL